MKAYYIYYRLLLSLDYTSMARVELQDVLVGLRNAATIELSALYSGWNDQRVQDYFERCARASRSTNTVLTQERLEVLNADEAADIERYEF